MKNDNGNKRKISKRKDPEAAASYYEEEGIPSLAVKEYLLNIANSTFENWRRANPDKGIEELKDNTYADVNFDGVADTLDAVQIQKFASGKI